MLWNNSWLDQKLAAGLPSSSVCDHDKLKATGQVITFREIRTYYDLAALEKSAPDDDFFDELAQLEAESVPDDDFFDGLAQFEAQS